MYENDDLRGYIWLWKKIIVSEIFKYPELFRLWCYCILKANWTDGLVKFNIGRTEKEFLVKRGQFICGARKMSKDLGVPYRTIHRWLRKLEEMGLILIDVTHQFSVVTILKYNEYNGGDIIYDPASKKMVPRRPTINGKNNNSLGCKGWR